MIALPRPANNHRADCPCSFCVPRLKSLAERFWPNVSPMDGCWEWRGARLPAGYGRIKIRNAGKITMLGAHRVSWELHNGPIPDGLFVCHRCDNPPCVNPADRVAKGRTTRYKAAMTHCKRGHEFTAENTRVHGTSRQCLECHRIAARASRQTPEYKEKRKALRATPEHKEYMRNYLREYNRRRRASQQPRESVNV